MRCGPRRAAASATSSGNAATFLIRLRSRGSSEAPHHDDEPFTAAATRSSENRRSIEAILAWAYWT